MALDKTSMANLRFNELAKAYPGIPADGAIKDEMIKYFEADSSGIIKEFQANAIVLPGTLSNGGGTLTGTGKVT